MFVHLQDAARGSVSTVVLRGGTEGFLDDVERAIDDGINTSKVHYVNGSGRMDVVDYLNCVTDEIMDAPPA